MRKLAVAISTVAASVLIAMSAQAAEIYNKDGNKLDLYEKVNAKHYFSSNDVNDDDTTHARPGFKGETQTDDQSADFSQREYEFKGSRAEPQGFSKGRTRLVFAGLKFGGYGSIDCGHNYGVTYGIGIWTDVLPEFGDDAWTQTDVSTTGHTTGIATYRNNDFFDLIDDLNFAAQYQGKNDRADIAEADSDSFGLFTTYEYEGFSVDAIYAKPDRTDGQAAYGKNELNTSGRSVEVWVAGLKYDANNIYLATTYSEIQNTTVFGNNYIASKAQSFEAVAQYQSDFGLCPSVVYLQSKDKDLGAHGDRGLVKYVNAGATYYLNKNMSTFVDYKINLIDNSKFTKTAGTDTDGIIAVSPVYQF